MLILGALRSSDKILPLGSDVLCHKLGIEGAKW